MTVDTWVIYVVALSSKESAEFFMPYWNRMMRVWAGRRLDEIKPSDVQMLAKIAGSEALVRRNSIGGLSAVEHQIAAARRFFALAVKDGHCHSNPALLVDKPKRRASSRHALTTEQLEELFRAVPERETILLRFFLETGARREGLLNLTPGHLRIARQTVVLDEKGSKKREQPVSEMMMYALRDPSYGMMDWTRRQIDGVWYRLRRKVGWADDLGLSCHWLRHTAITRMEAHAGYAIAAAYAGHAAVGTTATYVSITVHDVAAAFSSLYDEPHPLAHEGEYAMHDYSERR